jgi:hypothetical protein
LRWDGGVFQFRESSTLDVKSVFDSWFASDMTFGGISNLRLPLYISGSVKAR